MGVPSYFSYIIKTHANILCKYWNIFNKGIIFDRLYMDCNSILYDSFHSVSQDQPYAQIEKEILEKTSDKIAYYIEQLKPQSAIYIAFDGVAPFAKIEQQKTRRYRAWYESSITSGFETSATKPVTQPTITSSMFTPGTEFMKKLSTHIKQKFSNKEAKQRFKVNEIIVATPEQAGEGEHKLYEHLRKYPLTDENSQIAIYGLDADLIMLSLFHLTYCPNIYIVREAPSFAHVLLQEEKEEINPEEPLFLDVAALGRCVSSEMNCVHPDPHRMYDYVFMCFFLGNDFLPHFPALNIRTHGMQILLDVYREVIGSTQERFLVSKNKPYSIQWREVTRLVQGLAKHEHVFIKQEYHHRKRWDEKTVHHFPCKTTKEKNDLIQQLPVLFRGQEHFIDPHESGWQDRYYHTLFPETPTKKQVCINYLEGLEWVFSYYTNGCMDWRWKYHYHYPPLLKDLAQYIPYGKMTFFEQNPTNPTSPTNPNSQTKPTKPVKTSNPNKPLRALTQLAYVLPPPLHEKLLPFHVHDTLQKKYAHCFPQSYDYQGRPKLEFQWAFCRYFWESHVEFPEIPIDTIQKWENEF